MEGRRQYSGLALRMNFMHFVAKYSTAYYGKEPQTGKYLVFSI
jgi:hypothetical protein